MLIKFLACIGLVWILKDSYIFYAPREYLKSKSKYLERLLSCSMCLGFWIGVFISFLIYLESPCLNLNLLYYPFAVSAFCWFFDSLLDLIQYQAALSKNKFKNES
jgi:hypothetical protein